MSQRALTSHWGVNAVPFDGLFLPRLCSAGASQCISHVSVPQPLIQTWWVPWAVWVYFFCWLHFSSRTGLVCFGWVWGPAAVFVCFRWDLVFCWGANGENRSIWKTVTRTQTHAQSLLVTMATGHLVTELVAVRSHDRNHRWHNFTFCRFYHRFTQRRRTPTRMHIE